MRLFSIAEQLAWALDEASQSPRTVPAFVEQLKWLTVRYDKQQSEKEAKRQHGVVNMYRLGLLLQATERIESDTKTFGHRDDREAMIALRSSVLKHFLSDFPPAKKIVKMIDARLAGMHGEPQRPSSKSDKQLELF